MNRIARIGALSVQLMIVSLGHAWAQLPPPPGPAAPPPPPAAAPAAPSPGLDSDLEQAEPPAAEPEPAADVPATSEPTPKAPGATAATAGPGITEEEFQKLEAERERRLLQLKNHSALNGSTGLLRTHYAGSGPSGTFRFGVQGSYLSTSGFLCPQCEAADGGDSSREDSVSRVGANIQLSATLWDFLEAYAGIHSTATSNTLGDPELLQVLGDSTWGLKAFMPHEPDQLFTAGGALELGMLNGTGGVGVAESNFALRGLATMDLSNTTRPEDSIPLRFNVNLSYVFDNSGALVQDVEQARSRRITRIERFGLNINRVDRIVPALGVEGTFEAIRPYLEWSVDVPSNRQNYSCVEPDVHAGDTCLKSNPSFGSVPSRLTLGARAFAFVDGLSFHAALDLATGGNAPLFWEEVQPEAPWNLHFGLSYAADTEPRIERVLVKQPVPEAAPEKPKPVVRYVISGVVVEEGAEGVTVANAVIRYQGRDLTGMVSNAQGAFQTGPLEPGNYVFDVTAPDYQPGTCQAVIAPAPEPGAPEAEAGADSAVTGELPPDAVAEAPVDPLAGSATDSADPDAPRERVEVTEVRCPLKGKPKLGTVVVVVTDGTTRAPIAGATVTPTTEDGRSLSLESDENGATRFSNVPAGALKISVQATGYYKTQRQIKVQAGQEHTNTIEVSKVGPRTIAVGKTNLALKKPLAFKPGTAELLPESRATLDELAQLLSDQPKLSIELQAHTDDSLPAPAAVSLTTDRANAIRSQLVAAGVASGRVSALGMGAEKPLVPNNSDKNKEKNNRVEILVKSAP